MLKQPGLISYDDNIGTKLKKRSFVISRGVKYVQKIISTDIDPRFVKKFEKIENYFLRLFGG